MSKILKNYILFFIYLKNKRAYAIKFENSTDTMHF